MTTLDDLAAGLSALAGCTLEAAGLELDAALERLMHPPRPDPCTCRKVFRSDGRVGSLVYSLEKTTAVCPVHP